MGKYSQEMNQIFDVWKIDPVLIFSVAVSVDNDSDSENKNDEKHGISLVLQPENKSRLVFIIREEVKHAIHNFCSVIKSLEFCSAKTVYFCSILQFNFVHLCWNGFIFFVFCLHLILIHGHYDRLKLFKYAVFQGCLHKRNEF